jgi:hypothetical protein
MLWNVILFWLSERAWRVGYAFDILLFQGGITSMAIVLLLALSEKHLLLAGTTTLVAVLILMGTAAEPRVWRRAVRETQDWLVRGRPSS